MLDTFHRLSVQRLRDLAHLLRTSTSVPPTTNALQQVAGTQHGGELSTSVRQLIEDGWTSPQLATVADAMVDARADSDAISKSIDLVLSGPDVPNVATRDTAAVMPALLSEALEEVLLVGYVIRNARQLFAPLAARLASGEGLNVWCCLDIGRERNDTSDSIDIVQRFARDFRERYWPWEPRAAVYYDPRSLQPHGPTRSSMHAKCVIIDRKAALITSTNFTEAAQIRNIECGVIVRDGRFAARIAAYFEGLRATQQLLRCRVD